MVRHFKEQLRIMGAHDRTYNNQIHNILQISAFNRMCRWHKHYGKKEKSWFEVYEELKERSKDVVFKIGVEKKSVVQNI
jgi:hypothetical protein